MKPTIEQQVLLELLKGELEELPAGFDAGLFLQLLRRHKLLPLAVKVLGMVDEKTKTAWKEVLHGWVFRSAILFNELKQVIRILEKQQIRVISLKGPTLSHLLYQNPHGRFYSDLDLVLHPGELTKAVMALSETGYTLKRPSIDLSDDQWRTYFENLNDVGLVNREKRVYIELHRGIYVPGLLEQEAEKLFLDLTTEYEINGFRFNSLRPASYFLYLCFHGAKHMYFRLCWLRDVAEFLRRDDLDVNEVVTLARDLEMEKVVRISLALANRYFGIAIPPGFGPVVNRLDHPGIMLGLADRIILGPGRTRLFKDVLYIGGRRKTRRGIDRARFSHWLSRNLFLFLLRNSARDRFSYIYRIFVKKKILKA